MTDAHVCSTAVVLGLSPTGLYAIRELGRAGVKVVGLAEVEQAGTASRYLAEYLVANQDEDRLAWLEQVARQSTGKPVLIPASDQDIEFILRHKAKLSNDFLFQESYADGNAELLLTKQLFYATCSRLGVDFPKLLSCERGDLNKIKREVNFPLIAKPSRIHEAKAFMAGKKGWVVRSEDEFDHLAKKIPAEVGTLLIQELVPGPESNISLYAAYVDSNGQFCQEVMAKKIRQYPPGFGSASLVQTGQDLETRDIARAFLAKIQYRGIAAVEFKRDIRDGKLKIIEINARPSLWFEVSHAAGKRLCLAAFHDLQKSGVAVPEEKQIDGVVWRYFLKDLYSAWFYRLKKDFVLPVPDLSAATYSHVSAYAVFASDDPKPVWSELKNVFGKIVARVGLALKSFWKKVK